MKKLILSAAMLAFGSFTAFSAACVNGTLATVIATGGGSCTMGASNQWTLNAWGLTEVGAFNYGSGINPTTDDIFVTFQNLTGDGTLGANGALGFSVTFSDAGPRPSTADPNFFSASNVGQSANWQSFFNVNNASGDAIKQVYNSLNGASSGGNAGVQVNKYVSIAGQTPALGNVNIIHTNGVGPLPAGTVLVPGLAANTATALQINDYFQIQSSVGTGSAAATSYANSFFGAAPPDTGVPEPMSFVLMGAGLVGIAALRRRNG